MVGKESHNQIMPSSFTTRAKARSGIPENVNQNNSTIGPQTAAAILSKEQLDLIKSQLTELLVNVTSSTKIPGLGVALNLDGQRVEAYAGKISVDRPHMLHAGTRFQIGGLTMLLTAIVASKLIEVGQLDHNLHIGHYLGELANTDKGQEVCVWHLMSHTSGYQTLHLSDPGVVFKYDWDQLVAHLRSCPQRFKPGSVYSMDFTGYVLLGEIIRRVTRRSVMDLIQEQIFLPLKIELGQIEVDAVESANDIADHVPGANKQSWIRTAPSVPESFWAASISNLRLTLVDLAKISMSIIGDKSRMGTELSVFSSTVCGFLQKQNLLMPQSIGQSINSEQIPAASGIAMMAYRGWLLGHFGCGAGQTCAIRIDPRMRMALAVGMNVNAPSVRDGIISQIFATLRGLPLPRQKIVERLANIADIPGIYDGPAGMVAMIKGDAASLKCDVESPYTAPLRISIDRQDGGGYSVMAGGKQLSMAFFVDRDFASPCFQLDHFTFKKRGAEQLPSVRVVSIEKLMGLSGQGCRCAACRI